MTQPNATAENLTDKQIRAERTLQRSEGNFINAEICSTALGELHGARGQVADFALEEIEHARVLIAAAINARREAEQVAMNKVTAENLTDEQPRTERQLAVQMQMERARQRGDWAEWRRLARTNEARRCAT